MKKLSTTLIAEFNKTKNSYAFSMLNDEAKNEVEFNHNIILKNQINREIYAEKFGIYFADDIITDEEIESISQLEEQIAKDVANQFKIADSTRTKPSSKSSKNLNHLFA